MASTAKQHSSKSTRYQQLHTDRSKLSSKCVSEICTCGLHKCPKVKQIPFQATTTNQELYRPYKIQKTQPQIEQPIPKSYRHYDAKNLQTTYNAQFTQKKIVVGSNNNQNYRVTLTPPKNTFQGQTQYNSKYLKNKIRTQKTDEINCTPKRQSKITRQINDIKPISKNTLNQCSRQTENGEYKQAKKVCFKATTTYEQQFRPYKVKQPVQESFVQNQTKKVPFKATTQYENVYKRYNNLSYSQEKPCVIEELPPYPNKLPLGQNHIKYSYKQNAWK